MKLIKILSDRIQIRTDLAEFRGVKLNDLLSISDGTVELVTMVTGLADTDADAGTPPAEDDGFLTELAGAKTIDCAIIGSVQDGRFCQAIDTYPTTDAVIRKVSADAFAAMIDYGSAAFPLGVYAAYGCPACIDGNKFYQRHACIVGNTGSGKSESVAKILEETAKLPGANIIVFDIHGEYSKLSYAENIKLGKDFPFPVWMFGFYEMAVNILRIREETSSVTMAALRKCYYKICPEGKENRPVYFNYDQLIEEMKALNVEEIFTGELYKTGSKAGVPKMAKGDYNGKLNNIINLLEDKVADSRYSFLFMDQPQSYFIKLITRIMDNRRPVKNIDLSDIPHDVAIPIIGVITKLVYDIQRTFDVDSLCPVTLVCDEAHVYIPNDFQLSASQRRMVGIFEDIAKEGRKFGMTLLVASQRPSELNRTIMAQCANFIVMKLNNENDKMMMKGMLPEGDAGVIEATTMFYPGDALVIGDCIPFPLKVHVALAAERPQSRTIPFWDRWSDGSAYDYAEKADYYMNH